MSTVPTAQADPVNLDCDPALDPCRTQPGVALARFLMANATPAGEAPFLDCFVPRNFRMRDLFPSRIVAEDEQRGDGFLAKFLDALDKVVNDAFNRVDCFPTVIDPLRCPTFLLDQLLFHYGSPFTLEEGLDDTKKRQLVSVLFLMYSLKGTCIGIESALRFIYGINVTECVQPNIECWELGVSELNITTILCPSNAFQRRSFSLMVDVNLTDKQRDQMRNIVDWMKPANTHFIRFIEPGDDQHDDHWILGISILASDTVAGGNTYLH